MVHTMLTDHTTLLWILAKLNLFFMLPFSYCKYNNTIYEYGDIPSIVVSMKLEVNTCYGLFVLFSGTFITVS